MKKEDKTNLTKDQLNLLKKEISESLSRDRYNIVCNFPFTGSVAMRLELKPIRDKRCRTACTDGKSVYFDCDFYSQLNENERLFVLSHEVWHCIMIHLARKQNRDIDLFNQAADMEVNNLLVEHTTNSNKMVPPKNLLFPPKHLKGKSAELIYEWLLTNKEKNGSDNGDSGSSSACKSDKTGNSDDCMNNDNADETADGDSNKQGGKSGEGGNEKTKDKSKGLTGQFDKHVYEGYDDITNVAGKITDQWGEVGYDNDFTPSVDKNVADKLREMVNAAAQQYERERGTLPAGIDGIIDKIHKPEISWNEVLVQFVTSCYGGKRRWLPPNRRHIYNETYFQSRRNETINIAVALDTSGSCLGELPKFFGELKGLIDSFGSYTIHLIQCDAAVASYEIYEDGCNPLEIEYASEIKYAGGGGTSFCPVFNFIEKEGIEVDCLIYLTDSFGDAPENPPNYPVLWLLTKDGNPNFCDWGKKIKFKQSAYEY